MVFIAIDFDSVLNFIGNKFSCNPHRRRKILGAFIRKKENASVAHRNVLSFIECYKIRYKTVFTNA